MFLTTADKQMIASSKNGDVRVVPQIAPAHPDPQVKTRAPRRHFTAAEKLRILTEADACQPGQLGALLRREGIYSSTLANFRKQRAEGKLDRDPQQMRQQRRERAAQRQRDARRIAHLEAENRKLRALLDLQKKVAEVMALSSENPIRD